MDFGGWVLYVPEQEFIRVGTDDWRFSSSAINEDVEILQTYTRCVDKSELFRMIQDRLGKSYRIEKLQIDIPRDHRRNIADDEVVHKICKLVD